MREITESRTMKVRNKVSGVVTERHAPDADEMVARGDWEYVPANTPSIQEALSAMSAKEVAIVASRAPVPLHADAHDPSFLVNKLIPFVESGAVTIN